MGVFGRIRESLSRTKQQIVDRFDEIVRTRRRARAALAAGRRRDARGARGAADLGRHRRGRDRPHHRGREEARRGAARACAISSRQEIRRDLRGGRSPLAVATAPPQVTLIVGVNGTGKTTTVGKLANLLKKRRPTAAHLRRRHVPRRGRRAARDLGDARRRRHGARARGRRSGGGGVRRDLVGEGQGTRSRPRRHGRPPAHARQPDERARQDPAHRVARGARARRRKCCSCSTRRSARTALAQAREFTSVAGVNGIVLTKLDGTAKGGVAVAIAHDLKLPIRYVGVGEGHRRSRAVLGATSTSTACSRKSGRR